MIEPSIEKLAEDKYNRYELVIATAKCARRLTDMMNAKLEEMESIAPKDSSDKNFPKMEISDEKAVKTAINKIYKKEYTINTNRKSQ